MSEKVISIKLDRLLRRAVDGPAVASLECRGAFDDRLGIHPSDVLEFFVFKVLRRALDPYVTEAAVCRYDPFRGILFVRYGNRAGRDWIDGGTRPTQGGRA